MRRGVHFFQWILLHVYPKVRWPRGDTITPADTAPCVSQSMMAQRGHDNTSGYCSVCIPKYDDPEGTRYHQRILLRVYPKVRWPRGDTITPADTAPCVSQSTMAQRGHDNTSGYCSVCIPKYDGPEGTRYHQRILLRVYPKVRWPRGDTITPADTAPCVSQSTMAQRGHDNTSGYCSVCIPKYDGPEGTR